jgi:hypothetical protein
MRPTVTDGEEVHARLYLHRAVDHDLPRRSSSIEIRDLETRAIQEPGCAACIRGP